MDVELFKLFAGGGIAALIAGYLLVFELPAIRKTFSSALEMVTKAFQDEMAEQRKQTQEHNAKILDALLNKKD